MKTRILLSCLAASVLLNVVGLPLLAWQLIGYSINYRQNVDYVAELAYTVGYHKALGNNLATELETYPTRLQITEVKTDSVVALIWPSKQQSIHLDFSNPKICYASIIELGHTSSGGLLVRSNTNADSLFPGQRE